MYRFFLAAVDVIPAAVVLIPVFIVLYFKRFDHNLQKCTLYCVFCLYLSAMFVLVGIPNVSYFRPEVNLNLIPLKGMVQDLKNGILLQKLEKAFPKPWGEGRKGTQIAPKVYLEPGEKFDWPDLSAPEEEGPYFCYGLRDQIGILWDGTVVPCCLDHDGDIPLGNLLCQSMEEILDSPRAKAIYDGFSKREAAEPLCRRCGYARRFK